MYIAVNKRTKYGSMYIPKGEKLTDGRTKGISQPNDMDALRAEIKKLKDELAKQNRNNLDALNNLDARNFSRGVNDTLQSVEKNKETVKELTGDIKTIQDEYIAYFFGEGGQIEEIRKTFAQFGVQVTQDAAISTMLSEFLAAKYGENGQITQLANSIASIETYAGKDGANIELLTEWRQEMVGEDEDGAFYQLKESVAAIQETSDEHGARIDLVVLKKEGSDGEYEINTAGISLALQEDESFIQLVADEIVAVGDFITTDGLASTKISGNQILLGATYDDAPQLDFDDFASVYTIGTRLCIDSHGGEVFITAETTLELNSNGGQVLINFDNGQGYYEFTPDGIYYNNKMILPVS